MRNLAETVVDHGNCIPVSKLTTDMQKKSNRKLLIVVNLEENDHFMRTNNLDLKYILWEYQLVRFHRQEGTSWPTLIGKILDNKILFILLVDVVRLQFRMLFSHFSFL